MNYKKRFILKFSILFFVSFFWISCATNKSSQNLPDDSDLTDSYLSDFISEKIQDNTDNTENSSDLNISAEEAIKINDEINKFPVKTETNNHNEPEQSIIEEINSVSVSESESESESESVSVSESKFASKSESEKKSINLLFGGDIMAHSNNYNVSKFSKIWAAIKDDVSAADLAFANIEAPIDTTKEKSSYPNFNMTKEYVDAAIDAGFDAFSLCNNHTNDQGKDGILETMKTTEKLIAEAKEKGNDIYFSGIKKEKDDFTYNIIEKNGWKILFLPITELLNTPKYTDFINFVSPGKDSRNSFINYCKKLKEKTNCDLFILSVHTCEPEYTRAITEKQNSFYMNLLDAGVDIIWANHAHIIKDRKFIFNSENQTQKLIMYANGNTISGQRTKPELTSKNPNGERDNTGDGLLYSLTLEMENGKIKIKNAKPIFITTYINTANEYIIKKLDDDFVSYLEAERKEWADYIRKRIKISSSETRDLILWQ